MPTELKSAEKYSGKTLMYIGIAFLKSIFGSDIGEVLATGSPGMLKPIGEFFIQSINAIRNREPMNLDIIPEWIYETMAYRMGTGTVKDATQSLQIAKADIDQIKETLEQNFRKITYNEYHLIIAGAVYTLLPGIHPASFPFGNYETGSEYWEKKATTALADADWIIQTKEKLEKLKPMLLPAGVDAKTNLSPERRNAGYLIITLCDNGIMSEAEKRKFALTIRKCEEKEVIAFGKEIIDNFYLGPIFKRKSSDIQSRIETLKSCFYAYCDDFPEISEELGGKFNATRAEIKTILEEPLVEVSEQLSNLLEDSELIDYLDNQLSGYNAELLSMASLSKEVREFTGAFNPRLSDEEKAMLPLFQEFKTIQEKNGSILSQVAKTFSGLHPQIRDLQSLSDQELKIGSVLAGAEDGAKQAQEIGANCKQWQQELEDHFYLSVEISNQLSQLLGEVQEVVAVITQSKRQNIPYKGTNSGKIFRVTCDIRCDDVGKLEREITAEIKQAQAFIKANGDLTRRLQSWSSENPGAESSGEERDQNEGLANTDEESPGEKRRYSGDEGMWGRSRKQNKKLRRDSEEKSDGEEEGSSDDEENSRSPR